MTSEAPSCTSPAATSAAKTRSSTPSRNSQAESTQEAGTETQHTNCGKNSIPPLSSTSSDKSKLQSPERSASSRESGEVEPSDLAAAAGDDATSAPPLPREPPPAPEDDGWDFHWDATHQAYFFHNRFTNETTWENPRISNQGPAASAASPSASTATAAPGAAEPPKNERPPAGGYNPAIHGDYDPNAWYARGAEDDGGGQEQPAADPSAAYAAAGSFNRFTGRWQDAEQNPERHGDEAKSRRQMNAFFDVDAAANSHDGRSLKAERSGKKPSKAELKQFKEKRKAKKEEKRRAWLRD